MNEQKLKNIMKHFIEFGEIDFEPKAQYTDLYENIDDNIKLYFIYFHQHLNSLLQFMNSRGANAHYTANESRFLLSLIDKIKEFQLTLKNTRYNFDIDSDYLKWMNYCELFLETSGGSTIPSDYKRVTVKNYEPIFYLNNDNIILSKDNNLANIKMDLKGEGAYAKVFSFIEPITGKKFAKKRLNKDIEGKEITRFKLEFQKMNEINNPYILKAYKYNDDDNSYIMDYCDYTLKKYIETNNTKEYMTFSFRKRIAMQFLNGIKYLHSKDLLHRDISFNNVLIKEYDDNFVIVKISDFGLIKDKNLDLTSTDSDIRGTIIDDTLISFKDYNIKNEIYAIGVVLWFIFTGKRNLSMNDKTELGRIVNKCIVRDHSKRYNNVDEIMKDVAALSIDNLSGKVPSTKKYTTVASYNMNSNEINGINENSFQFLKAMVEDTASNQMYFIKTLAGESYETSDGKFKLDLEECSPRDKIYWKDSFNLLIEKDLIKSINRENDIFEVTKKGYEIYDVIIKSKQYFNN